MACTPVKRFLITLIQFAGAYAVSSGQPVIAHWELCLTVYFLGLVVFLFKMLISHSRLRVPKIAILENA